MDSSVQAIVDNSMESFDHFWKTDQLVDEYLVQARQNFYEEVLVECGPYLHGISVMLQGHGGDELFWGYPWVRQAAMTSFRPCASYSKSVPAEARR